MEFKTLLEKRRSIRSYTGDVIEDEKRVRILEAAQRAPIGMPDVNPLHITIVRDKQVLEEIEAAAQAAFKMPENRFLYEAPEYMIVSAKKENNLNHSNAAIVCHHMVLQAVELDIGACHIWGATMAIKDNEALLKTLEIPEGFTPLCGLVLGISEENYVKRELKESISMNTI